MGEALVGRYWCHMCNQVVNPIQEPEIRCPYCDGGFVEEMDGREEDLDGTDLRSDRALSLWAPILLGMVGGGSSRHRSRRYRLRDDDDDDDNDDDPDSVGRELEATLRRRRRSSTALLHLLQGLREELALDSGDRDRDRDRERERERERGESNNREGVILINNYNQAIILQGSPPDPTRTRNRLPGTGTGSSSLGDYFVGPGLDMLLQHLAENDPNRYGTPPASKEAVEGMPSVKVAESLGCPVCLEDLDVGAEAKEMPCKHKFHAGCILPWLELHSSCPVCRFQLPAEESKDPSPARREESRGGGGGSDRSFWVPVPWPFSGLFSSSDSHGGGGGGGSSSSSSSRQNHGD